MAYDFDFSVSATINADTATAMLTALIEQQTGRTVKTLAVKFKEVQDGTHMYPMTRTVFDGCEVTFETVTGNKYE